MILANGARQIVDARMKGLKPADLIIVSLIGPTDDLNTTVYARPNTAYDWRWTAGLDIALYANQKTVWEPTAKAIALRKPKTLTLWDVERFEGAEVYTLPMVEDIEKPQETWRHALHFIPWLDFQNRQFAWGA